MSIFQTTTEQMSETFARDKQQREGQGGINQLVKSELVHNGKPGTGVCKWGAQFTYANGQVETLWGMDSK